MITIKQEKVGATSQTKHANTPTLRKIHCLHFLAFITLHRNSIRRKTEVIAVNLTIKSGNSHAQVAKMSRSNIKPLLIQWLEILFVAWTTIPMVGRMTEPKSIR